MAPVVSRLLTSPSLEPLTLVQAERRARSYSAEQAARIRELTRAAALRARAALELRAETQMTAAFAIFREVFVLGLRAVQVAEGKSPEVSVENASVRLEELCARGDLPEPEFDFEKLTMFLKLHDPLELDRLPREERLALSSCVESGYRWLFGAVEARTPRQIMVLRIVQPLVGALGVALLILVTLLVFGTSGSSAP